ncbi:EAL domain-containing protein, partial [Arthrospira platensis SPKY1]|nr:EAL domain-containing protein [Arthrospira platensis SPKY1]
MIPPDRFIPLAEKSGMIVAIGLFVMRSACRCIARLHQQGHTGLSMAINVSQVQLKEADFIEQLEHIMTETGVNPAAIELEITESMAADDLTFIVSRLQQIRNLGVRIAIDDFGTGFSSLSVLRHLPATRLKIDRAFVNELNSDDSIA